MKKSMGFCLAILLAAVGAAGGGEAIDKTVGAKRVTILTVTGMDIPTGVLHNVEDGWIRETAPDGTFPVPVKVAALRHNATISLFDAGMHPHTAAALRGQDMDPDTVTDVYLTHMHYDHIDGLLENGAPVFPNATLHLSEAERAYWQDRNNLGEYPGELREVMEGSFDLCAAVFAAYEGRIQTFVPGTLAERGRPVTSGIAAVDTAGHTAGHVSYIVTDGGDSLYIAGDEIHFGALQLRHPEVTIAFDRDQATAAATRQAVFTFLAKTGMPFTAMHLDDTGTLVPDDGGAGGYRVAP